MLVYELMAKLAEYPSGMKVVIQQTDDNGEMIVSTPVSCVNSFTEGDEQCVIFMPDKEEDEDESDE